MENQASAALQPTDVLDVLFKQSVVNMPVVNNSVAKNAPKTSMGGKRKSALVCVAARSDWMLEKVQ